LVNVYADGSIQVSTGATEMGQGVNTKIRQLVADTFGVGIEHVRVMSTSTEKNNNTAPTAASVSTDLNGAAALDACEQIQRRLDELVARACPSERERPRFEDLCQLAWHERIDLGARGFYATPSLHFDWESGRGEPFFYFTSGAAVSEVAIDRFTGDLRVRRVDILMDTGHMINPGIDRGQIIGGFVQGMGWCTSEKLVYDGDGGLRSDNTSTYKIPGVADIPERFHLATIERENALNLAGSRALGEPPLLLGLSVWAAIKHALSCAGPGSIPKLELPATGEAILEALTDLQGETP
jgi:xanthine dehydrogenase large subunit